MKIKKKRHIQFKPRFYAWIIGTCIIVTSFVFLFNFRPDAKVREEMQDVAFAAEAFKEMAVQTTKIGQDKLHSESEKKVIELETRIQNGDTKDIKVVYLTFDDGPNENTGAILDMLNQYKIKATFFTNGRESEEALQAYKRIVDEGHVLANHTYSHQYNLYNNPQAFYDDVKAVEALQARATGMKKPSGLFRFPGGSLNANSTCIKGILERGYNYADWNVSAGDGGSNPKTVESVVRSIVGGVHQHDVSTVLCHAETKSTTREALPQIIETLKKEGYTFLKMNGSMDIYPRQV